MKTKEVEERFLYLIKDTKMELLTEAEAAYRSMMGDCEVTNVSEMLDMGPELVFKEDLNR